MSEITTGQKPVAGGGRFMTGLVVGAAAGAALGVLLAPRSGRQTRRDLAKSAQRLQSRVEDAYDNASDGLETMMDSGREAFDAVASNVASASKPLTDRQGA